MEHKTRGIKFDSDEVQNAVHKWLRSQPKILLAVGIRRLVNGYKIYVEKRLLITLRNDNTLRLSQVVAHEVINKITLLFDFA